MIRFFFSWPRVGFPGHFCILHAYGVALCMYVGLLLKDYNLC